MNKKRKVTVFLPAYNEASNIKSIITKLLKQSEIGYVMDSIVVVNDGSTDSTAEIVRSIRNRRIKLIDNKENKGKVFRNNEFFKSFDGDILVQIDSDSLIKSKNLISNLVKPFLSNSTLSMSCGTHKALPAKTFAEKIASFGVDAWYKSLELAGNPERYFCYGQIRALSREFANKLIIPNKYATLSEDVYSFYFAKKHKKETIVVWNACVYFRLPSSINDYKKQMKRFLSSPMLTKDVFGESLTKKYDVLRTKHKVLGFVIEFIKSPFIGTAYAVLQIITKIEAKSYVPAIKWDVAQSTKNI